MTTVTFDTLSYAEALKAAGVPETQAKGQAQALAEVLLQSGQGLATKADIADLRAATKLYIAELKTEIPAMISSRSPAIIIGSMAAMTGIFAATVKLL